MTGQVAIDARGVSKIFGQGSNEVRALDDVSVQIRPNEFFTLLGPSGCGKTTLLRLIAGFETPSLGSIFLDGADITLRPPFQRPVNTVFQSYALFPHLSVAENIGFGLEMQGRAKSDTAETVREMLALVRMEAMADRKPGQLSGGQQQRVALARALAPKPSVLLLDEPLSALDLKLRKEMQIELKRLQTETGITFVFVTHDQEEALTMSDRIGVMSAGKLLQIGSPRDIYDNPSNRFVAGFIGESNFLQGAVKSVSGDVAIVALANGCDQAALVPAGVTPSGKATLSIRPEQIVVTQENRDGAMPATVESTVYFGTDTHCHLRLEGGDILVSRVQNNTDGGGRMKAGDRVGVTFATGAARVLGD